MNFKEAKALYQESEKNWIDVSAFSFLYMRLNDSKKIQIYLKAEENKELDIESLYLEEFLENIIDWKNVRACDVYDTDDEELIEFDKEIFDDFLAKQLGIIEKIFFQLNDIEQKYEERKTKIVNNIKKTIEDLEYERLCKEVSKTIRREVKIDIFSSIILDLYNRCVCENKISWEDVIFWCSIKELEDIPLICELIMITRHEYSEQYEKRDERKKEIEKRSAETSKLLALKFKQKNGAKDV